MSVHKVLILAAVMLASSTVDCVPLTAWSGQQVPARCVALSVTPVSCAQHTPDNLLAHPDDCELFYYCVTPEAVPVCRQCPAHLHFNPHLRVCDHPETSGCVSNAISQP